MKHWLGWLALAGSVFSLLACSSNETARVDNADAGNFFGPDLPDANWQETDGGFVGAFDASWPKDRFLTQVVSFTPGICAGYGAAWLPGVVLGPPVGGGDMQGSLDAVSLGNGGEIVISVLPGAIVDEPGPDFVVFENAFFTAGNTVHPFAEPGEVSVSDDGVNWHVYPCTATEYPYGSCAGWHPVYSSPLNSISPLDPAVSGGDSFDLADVGLARARYIRIRDMTQEECGEPPKRADQNGFDLDAVAIIHAGSAATGDQ